MSQADERLASQVADRDPALLTALTTEHFVLQTAAASTITEASSRASLYVLTLSSSLVAMGFAVRTDALAQLVATVVPVLVILGIFTTVRLVDTGVQNMQHLMAITRIHDYYRTLTPDAPQYFPVRGGDDATEALAAMALRRRPMTALFTSASMIAIINSVVAGAAVCLLAGQWWTATTAIGVGLAFVATFYLYQSHRYRKLHAAATHQSLRHATRRRASS